MKDPFEKPQEKSPIKEKLQRAPGQALHEKRLGLYHDKFLEPIILTLVFGVLAGMEWWRYLFQLPPMPYFYSLMFVVVVIYAIWRTRRVYKVMINLLEGEKGERAVAQMLDRLRSFGYEPFHDIQEEDGNIDHVLVGPAGVFAIETKTRMKPGKGKTDILYDGQFISINDGKPIDEPLVQAKACARSVQRRIRKATGREVFVRAVVIYPGWFVKTTVPAPEVWAMNEGYFEKRVADLEQAMTNNDIGLLAGAMKLWQQQESVE